MSFDPFMTISACFSIFSSLARGLSLVALANVAIAAHGRYPVLSSVNAAA